MNNKIFGTICFVIGLSIAFGIVVSGNKIVDAMTKEDRNIIVEKIKNKKPITEKEAKDIVKEINKNIKGKMIQINGELTIDKLLNL